MRAVGRPDGIWRERVSPGLAAQPGPSGICTGGNVPRISGGSQLRVVLAHLEWPWTDEAIALAYMDLLKGRDPQLLLDTSPGTPSSASSVAPPPTCGAGCSRWATPPTPAVSAAGADGGATCRTPGKGTRTPQSWPTSALRGCAVGGRGPPPGSVRRVGPGDDVPDDLPGPVGLLLDVVGVMALDGDLPLRAPRRLGGHGVAAVAERMVAV